jgi:hypothetical protein
VRVTSYRLGERVPVAAQRAAGDLIIGPRLLLAAYAHRSERTVRTHCLPVACDVGTRAFLYDLEACCELLGCLRRAA